MNAEARRRQSAAADPRRSSWVAANAGSGKTRALIDRVARLLLENARPENILCLTYTRAAAGEMQNRLFSRLGEWAMVPDDKLREALAELGVAMPVTAARLAAARRLFAAAIEAPGGLKIQTIHAFCAAILRQFPREAGVAPGFTEIDDRSLAMLIDGVLDAMASDDRAPLIDALAAQLAADDDLGRLCTAILSNRHAFAAPFDHAGALAVHDLPPGFDATQLLTEVFRGDEAVCLRAILPALAVGNANDRKAAARLAEVTDPGPRSDPLHPLRTLEEILLYGAGAARPYTAKAGRFPGKDVRAALPGDMLEALEALMLRVEAARPRRLALAAADRLAALHDFAAAFLPAVEAEKAARGWLDFDDLILRVRDLLSDSDVADWVHYRLDGRIDHILVDEAQDTSRVQWEIIALLAREVLEDTGAERTRTLFVVGDRKQSIYSFQGADAEAFERMQADFAARCAATGAPLGREAFLHSFRAAPAILEAVDATFGGGAPGLGAPTRHLATREGMAGRVDLWPMVPRPAVETERPWHEPVDRISPDSAPVVLARAVAGEIRRLIDAGETRPLRDGGRTRLTEGDILILVRRRGPLFTALIEACKVERLAIAGADRLLLSDALAVQDILALLNFLSLPEDDLSLAAALRSPLFGWSEDALYRLAQPRAGYLWAALRADPAHAATAAALRDLNAAADYLRPFDLIERILTRHGGREKLIARLDPECEEAIDALLSEALRYEETEAPSLSGFLVWLTAADAEVKRQIAAETGALRIMSVHGAKGLESPMVILPDCGPARAGTLPPILLDEAARAFWPPPAAEAPGPLLQLLAAEKARAAAELDRLLYVAMTRAESWLIVAAAGDPDRADGSWHARIATGLQQAGAVPHGTPTGEGLRLARGDWSEGAAQAGPGAAPAPSAPAWMDRPAPVPAAAEAPLSPSQLGGAKALPGEAGAEEDAALRRGTWLHLLLEHLPAQAEAGWPALAAEILRHQDPAPDPVLAAGLAEEATAVLTNPDLTHLFAPGTLAEVDISAHSPTLGRRLRGSIDRLVLRPGHALAVDFKTNAVIPARPEAVPEGLLRQMGAYAEALSAIYPDRAIETAILWTRTARLMPLPHAIVTRALRTAALQPGAS